MRKMHKSAAALALIMAISMAGSSMVYAGEPAKEDTTKENPAKESENEPALCNEGEHQLVESEVVLPTCTEKGYSIYRCKVDVCTYEEKRDETAPLGHDMKEVSVQEATADKPGIITYKCQRQGCDYTELAEVPPKDPNSSDEKDNDKTSESDTKPGTDTDYKSDDGKTDNSEENKNPDADNKTDAEDKNASSDKDNSGDGDNSADKNVNEEEDLPDEDIDEEYAFFASSTSTDIVTEYDPETAVGTIRVAKKDSDDPTETEEVTGMTVPTGTTEIKKDSDGNITDLAVSTAIDEIKNGFCLTSENRKLHSISIIDKKNPNVHWITLNAKETASELGIRLHSGDNKIVITLTENEKPLNIIKVSGTEKELILTTSTNGSCIINKMVQNISVDKDGEYSDKKTLSRKNQIILNDVNGSKPYLELVYVKEETETTSVSVKSEDATGDLETENSKTEASGIKDSESDKKKDPDEELYWIQPYGDESQEPIVITVYKK